MDVADALEVVGAVAQGGHIGGADDDRDPGQPVVGARWSSCAAARASGSSTGSTSAEWNAAAVASVLGFPLMLGDAVRRGHPLAPNQFLHLPRLGGALAPGLRDDERRTTRHSAWIDVSQTPIVVTLGDLQDRHFSLMAFDAWGDCVASLSSRTRSGASLA